MFIAVCQGQTTPGDKILMSTETTCHFGHLLQVSKKSLSSPILYNFFHYFIHVYSPGEGLTTPWGWNLDVNRNILSLRTFVASLKKISLTSDFIHLFNDFIHVYSPGAGADSPPGDKVLTSTEMSSLHSFVASFKKMSLKSDFKQFFSWLNTCL